MVGHAAATLQRDAGTAWPVGEAPEGPRWWLSVAPGRLRVGSTDLSRGQRASERLAARHDALIAAAVGSGDPVAYLAALRSLGGRGVITLWSGKSRANMVDRLSTLDYAPEFSARPPAMVTLTLPENWQEYAPAGSDFKQLVRRFFKRFERAWGYSPARLWKLEFQRRGAPHMHLLMVPPTGTAAAGKRAGQAWSEWFAGSWADVLGVAGETRRRVEAVHSHRKASADYSEGLRGCDPKRIAVYFLKHNLLGDKEYQHVVPVEWQAEGAGPGRFWGYSGLRVVTGLVPLTYVQAVAIARTLRRHHRAQRVRKAIRVWRVDRKTGRMRLRTSHVRSRRMTGVAGMLVVNDGPTMALWLGAVVEQSRAG